MPTTIYTYNNAAYQYLCFVGSSGAAVQSPPLGAAEGSFAAAGDILAVVKERKEKERKFV